MSIFTFVLTTLGLGILCAIPTIVIGRLLATRGIVHEMPVWVVVGTVCTLLAWRLLFPEASLGCFVTMGTILLPIGIYRHDLWTYFRRGRSPKNDELER